MPDTGARAKRTGRGPSSPAMRTDRIPVNRHPIEFKADPDYPKLTWTTRDRCYWCDAPLGEADWCPHCITEIEYRPSAKQMTTQERLDELDFWYKGKGTICMVNTDVIQNRLAKLLGRPVWTHELAHPDVFYKEVNNAK